MTALSFSKILVSSATVSMTLLCACAPRPQKTTDSGSQSSLASISSLVAPGYSFSVDAYGARPDGGADSTNAFKQAISAAIQSGQASEVVLSAGTYRLDCPSSAPAICFDIQGARGLTIRGQGASTKLLISNPLAGLLGFSNSSDITVTGFSIDYSSLPFSQGRIKAVSTSANAIDLAVDAGYPGLDQPIFSPAYLTQSFGMLFEANTPSMKGSAGNYFPVNSISKNGDGSFHLALANVGGMAIGDRFALPLRTTTSFTFVSTNNITLKQVSLYSGPGAASIWVGNTGRILIDGFEVRRKPGTNRLLSTAADAIHMMNNTANLIIQNSYIEGMGDDAINTRSEGFTIASLPSATVFKFNRPTPIKAGYTVQSVEPATQAARGSAKVIAVQDQVDNTELVTLDRAIPGATAGDMVFSADLASPNALIKNNTFSNFRGLFRIRSSGAIFVENQILDSRNASFLVAADIIPAWQEGPSLVSSLNGMYFSDNYVPGGSITLLGPQYSNLGAPTLSGSAALLTHPLVFNADVYRWLNPDLAAFTDQDVKAHWVVHGIAEGRKAQISFSPPEYLQIYADLRAAFSPPNYVAALMHYLYHGAILELREGSVYANHKVYDSSTYRSLNPDLAGFSDEGLGVHWLRHGIFEGRQASLSFHALRYLQRYPDLSAGFGATNYRSAIEHYMINGYYEGRSGL